MTRVTTGLSMLLIVLTSLWATPAAAQATASDRVVKTVCASAIGYDSLAQLKYDLLLAAKREAASELFGELIAAATTVENLVVTADQIRVQSLGLIRVEGSAGYANGVNLAEVCVTVTAYVTAQDRAQFVAETIDGRDCVTDAALPVRELRARAEEGARVKALLEHDPRLANYAPARILPLLRRIDYRESDLVAGTDTYCATVTGAVIPIEVTSFLTLDGDLLGLDAATPAPTATPTLRAATPTPRPATPTPARTVSPAHATATAFANRTPTFTPTPSPTPDSTTTAVALMVDVLATAEAAPHHIYDLWVNPVDQAVYVYVPAGEFTMGSGDGDGDEQPEHRVNLDDFWIMRTEVTNVQYAACVGAGACTPPDNSLWRDVNYAGHPVVNVNWDQAVAYAKWADGRLPTEAEWEKACRGGDRRTYPWGEAVPDATLLNFGDNPQSVGIYPAGASPYGALDMAGNAKEWTADWYDDGYYAWGRIDNPAGPANGLNRVYRGGGLEFMDFNLRKPIWHCANRAMTGPHHRGGDVGFRVVSPGS